MPRIRISSQRALGLGAVTLRHVANSPRARRLEARIAELDLAYGVEIKRLAILLEMMKHKYLAPRRQRG